MTLCRVMSMYMERAMSYYTIYTERAHRVHIECNLALHTMHIVHYALQIIDDITSILRYNSMSLVYYILLYISTLLYAATFEKLITQQLSKL